MSTDAPEELFSDDDGVLYAEEVTPQHGILGFTLRELLIVAVWLVLFVISFFPLGWGPSMWAQGISWLIPLGLPTVAVFLIVLRRFSPEGIRRVGSLGVDQFASVAFAVGALWWVQTLWEFVAASIVNGSYGVIWVPWVQVVALLALVVLTVFAPIIPGLREDFRGRLVTLAHRNANPVRPIVARPKPERPVVAASVAEVGGDAFSGGPAPEQSGPVQSAPVQSDVDELLEDGVVDESTHESIDQLGLGESIPLTAHASDGAPGNAPQLDDDYVPGYARTPRDEEDEVRHEGEAPQQSQPFWALAPTERDVFDEKGAPLFRIGPTAWALVLEDRGGAYVVRHDDGRIGYLHDIADITRG